MNAAEKIVEAYFREVKGLFTQTSIQGVQQSELDIVAVDPRQAPPLFYHIESSVSISSGFSRITCDPFDLQKCKERANMASQRCTAGFFIARKFFSEGVLKTLEKMGCKEDKVKRILVSWGFNGDAEKELKAKGIECLSLKTIFQELANHLARETKNLDSDILRTIQLFVRSEPDMPKIYGIRATRRKNIAKP